MGLAKRENVKMKKTKLTSLLLVLITLLSALFIPINAAEADTSENVGIEEIMPHEYNGNYWCGQPYNAKKVDENYLRQHDIDPHELKREVLGRNANISEYDIYRDVETGGLWLYKKDGTRDYVATYYCIK